MAKALKVDGRRQKKAIPRTGNWINKQLKLFRYTYRIFKQNTLQAIIIRPLFVHTVPTKLWAQFVKKAIG